MNTLDIKSAHVKKQLEAETLIFLQGTRSNSFLILHSGMVEILYNREIKPDSSPEDILKGSLRVGLIKGEALIDVIGLLNSEESHTYSVRTVSNCIITARPTTSEEFISKMQNDIPLNLKVLRDLIARIESSFYIFNNYKYLWHKYASIADSLALGCKIPESAMLSDSVSRSTSSLEEYSTYLNEQIQNNMNLEKGKPWDYNLFLGRLQNQMDLYKDKDSLRTEDIIDQRQYLFIKRLVQKDDKILGALFRNDEPTNRYIFNLLGETIHKMLNCNKNLATEIDQLIILLYSGKGWIKRIITENDTENPQIRNFLHFLTKFSWRCRKDTLLLLGKDILKEYEVFSELKLYKEYASPELERDKEMPDHPDSVSDRLAKYNGLLQKILDFSGLPSEFKQNFTSLVETLIQADNKLDSSPDMQKLRNNLSEKYWELYEVCFLKIIDSDLKGFIPGIMLHFGLIDERLINREELQLIDDFYAGTLYSDETIPVMTLPYFLHKIYKSEINPSMTEMGDLFKAVLKHQEKLTKREKEKTYLFENTPEDRIRFEIRKIAVDLGKLLSGNRKKSLPFLCSELLSDNLKRFFTDPEIMGNMLEKIRHRDFSLFYREVLFKNPIGSEFIQKEVIPNFVFYPIVGSRAVMWQEMDGSRKDSPGRLFFPLYFTGKLEETLLTQLAYFRWELQKTLAGYNWTDAVEGGLVGIYYDYIRFYKKNPNIIPEAKQRLEEFIKKTKSDKDRFALDYSTWVSYEYEGKLRFNNYVRDIFYRYCPFPENIRQDMSQKPAFAPLENRYKNRRQKDIIKLQSKINKFQKKDKPVPPELKEYMVFLEK